MRPARAARDADDGAARERVPVRRAEPGKGRHQHHAAGVLALARERFYLGRALDQLQAVAQPLDRGAAHEHAAFEAILRVVADLPANCRQQPVVRGHGLAPGIHQDEAAGAVGVLCHAGREADLAESSRLLVSGDAGDGDLGAEQPGRGARHLAAGGHHVGQQAARNVEQAEQFVVPAEIVDVEQQRA
ncbi:hypothetical protein D3C87_1269750 [compost metagenome]